MFTSETTIRVRYAETDQMGVVYHGYYFPYFEVARVESFRNAGITYADIEKTGVLMPVVDVHVRYLRPALYDDLLTVKTSIKEMPVHHKIEFHHEVFNEKTELLCVAKIILYFVQKEGMKKISIPELFKQKLEPYFNN